MDVQVTGVLLAAGAGTRLGGPKALLRTSDGAPLLALQVDRLRAAGCDRVIVVLGCAADRARRLVPPGAEAVVADDWRSGMGASLRAGLDAADAPGLTAVLVSLVDLAELPTEVCARLLEHARPDVLARVQWDGAPGHPVLIGAAHVPAARAAATGDTGARDLLEHAAASGTLTLVDGGDPHRGADVDTPEDCAAAGLRLPPDPPGTPAALAAALARTGYLASDDLATAAWLAGELGRPLLCEGVPGVGKTSLAAALAEVYGGPLFRLQCHEGITAAHALYDWDFAGQILHLRSLEAEARTTGTVLASDSVEDALHSRRFLLTRPVLRALEASTADTPAVLLIDELDRTDDEFEAVLLEVLSEWTVSVPELGRTESTIGTSRPPIVVLTSNRTREIHDALRRRCLYHWFEQPSRALEERILAARAPEASADLRAAVVAAAARLRELPLVRPPGTAETLDWLRALDRLGVVELTETTVRATLSTVLKDAADVRGFDPAAVLGDDTALGDGAVLTEGADREPGS